MEDVEGNITAKRVGTMVVKYDKDSDGWVNGATYEVLYGDITKHRLMIMKRWVERERLY